MKNILLLLLAGMILAGCAHKDVVQNHMDEIPTEPLKIKRMEPIYYEIPQSQDGCSEILFLQNFVGKKKKSNDGSGMRIDNILDIHVNSVENYATFWGSKINASYKCTFWGIGVEYEK